MKKLTGVKLLMMTVLVFAIFGTFEVFNRVRVLVGEASYASPSSDMIIEKTKESDLYRYDIKFRTGDDRENNSVSIITFRLKLNEKILNNEKEGVVNVNLSENLQNSDEWKVPVNTIYSENGDYVVEFSAVNTSNEGFLSEEYQTLVTFYTENEVDTVNIDTEKSFAYSKYRPVVNLWTVPEKIIIARI